MKDVEMFDEIMQEICDLGHHPYQAVDDEELEALFCSRCRVECKLKAVLEVEA